jgi:hypothetical protein
MATCWQTYDIGITVNSEINKSSAAPASLAEIFMFDEKINTFFRMNASKQIVAYTGSNIHRQAIVIFLLGCHLIMTWNIDLQQVRSIFRPLEDIRAIVEYARSMHNCWSALSIAKQKRWVSFKETFDICHEESHVLNMEEYLHYIR